MNNPVQIKFANSHNPRAKFDLLDLNELHNRKHLDHSPFELHVVNFFMIMLVTGDKGNHTIDFTNYKYKKNTLITIRKDQIQKFHLNKNVQGVLLLFTNEFLVSYLEELEALKSIQLFNELLGNPKVQLSSKDMLELLDLIKRIKKEYFKINDQHSQGIIRNELQILLAKLYRIKSVKSGLNHQRKYLNEFIQFQNLVELNAKKTIRVKDYALEMGVSTKTLNTITRSILNKSAKMFIDDICIHQIKRLLINTDYSIKEIAFMTGFEETTNFFKYFKRQTNLTPEQFRTQF